MFSQLTNINISFPKILFGYLRSLSQTQEYFRSFVEISNCGSHYIIFFVYVTNNCTKYLLFQILIFIKKDSSPFTELRI